MRRRFRLGGGRRVIWENGRGGEEKRRGGKGGEKGSGSGSESLRCLFVSDYLALLERRLGFRGRCGSLLAHSRLEDGVDVTHGKMLA